MNKGIGLATGELVGIINSDDWYEPDAIEKTLRTYQHQHIGDRHHCSGTRS